MRSSPETRAYARELLAEGHSYQEVAEAVGFSHWTVREWYPGYGNRKQARRLTEAEVTQAEQLLKDGASYEDAAETVGCSPTTLRYRFPDYGWTKQENGAHRHRAARLDRLKTRTQGVTNSDSVLRLSGTLEGRT